jgi:hypothetical protein
MERTSRSCITSLHSCYTSHMANTIQARLDEASRKRLEQLVKRLGWSPSKVVREGLRLLAACQPGNRPRKIIGLGKFASGIPDLGSNKKHLKDFGR